MAQLTQNKLHGLWGYLQMKGSRLLMYSLLSRIHQKDVNLRNWCNKNDKTRIQNANTQPTSLLIKNRKVTGCLYISRKILNYLP